MFGGNSCVDVGLHILGTHLEGEAVGTYCGCTLGGSSKHCYIG